MSSQNRSSEQQRRAQMHRARNRSARRALGSLGTCPCGKQQYHSRKHARAAAKVIFPGDHQQAYECREVPGIWHHGHLPSWLVAGEDRKVWTKSVAS